MSTTEDGKMTVNDLISQAEQAEAMGIPVDWKSLCYKTLNIATNYIAAMEAQTTPATEPDEPENQHE